MGNRRAKMGRSAGDLTRENVILVQVAGLNINVAVATMVLQLVVGRRRRYLAEEIPVKLSALFFLLSLFL